MCIRQDKKRSVSAFKAKDSKSISLALAAMAASFTLATHAVVKGEIANGSAYAAVIGIDSCSAVVIHPQAILTAAHCGPHLDTGRYAVHFPDRSETKSIDVKSVLVNPGYVDDISWSGEFKINDDIALLILSDPIDDPVILAHIPKIIDEGLLSKNEIVQAVGLGIHEQGPFAQLGDMDNSDKRVAPYKIVDKKLSTYYLSGTQSGVGLCGGDSGGALLRVSEDGSSSQLLGILTATGGRCGDNRETAYAESVASHLDWIRKSLKKEGITGI